MSHVLFPETEQTKSIFVGNGKVENNRLIIQIKVTDELLKEFKNDEIGLTVLKMKKPGKFGHTHTVVVNNNTWDKPSDINSNFVAIASGDSSKTFTLTKAVFDALKYTPKKGQGAGNWYVKLELVDNGMQCGIFKSFDNQVREIGVFKKLNQMISATAKAPSVISDENSARQTAKETLDDFFKGM